MVSCAFSGDMTAKLEEIAVDQASEALSHCLNQFFSECQQTQLIHQTPIEDLTLEQISHFRDTCVLSKSIGVQILGRLLHCIYSENPMQFDSHKVSQLAKIDWSQQADIWQGNIIVIDPNPTISANTYKISTSLSAVKIAVDQVKRKLGWMNPYPDNFPNLF